MRWLWVLLLMPSVAWAIDVDTMNVASCVLHQWTGTCPDYIDEDPPGDDGSAFLLSTDDNDSTIVDFTTPQLSEYDSVQIQWRVGRSGNPSKNLRIGWDTSGSWNVTDVSVASGWQTATMSLTGSPDSTEIANLEAFIVNEDSDNKDHFCTMICAIGYFTEPGAGGPSYVRRTRLLR